MAVIIDARPTLRCPKAFANKMSVLNVAITLQQVLPLIFMMLIVYIIFRGVFSQELHRLLLQIIFISLRGQEQVV